MTAPLPVAQSVLKDAGPQQDTILLSYEARLLRRKRLAATSGQEFLVDFERTESVREGDAFLLDDGSTIGVLAAKEPVLKITGDLTRLAWHIGNRHTPCEITHDALFIAEDPVLEAMLAQLGAEVTHLELPFSPEGGAYGHGRTFGHSHSHA